MARRQAEHVQLEAQSTTSECTLASLPAMGERIVRLGRGLGVALAIAVFWAGGFLLAWFTVPWIWLMERERLTRRRRMQLLVAASFRWFLRTLERTTLYRARYVGGELPDGPCVVVANHPSLLDVTAILSRMPHLCCVVKSSLVESPLVGRLLRSCGHVSAGDGTLMSGKAVLDSLCERLAEGCSVLVFPEGTRSPQGSVRKMRRGAFEVAQRCKVPLVPVFLRCDPPALGKGTPVWRHPLACPTLTVCVDPPLAMNDRDPALVCRELSAELMARLSQPVREEVCA